MHVMMIWSSTAVLHVSIIQCTRPSMYATPTGRITATATPTIVRDYIRESFGGW